MDDQALSDWEKNQRARERRKRAAEEFRPARIRLLLIAQAPPEEPDRYFYFTDVKVHDSLFRNVFEAVTGKYPSRNDKRRQLEELRDLGIFLIDLYDDLTDAPRQGTTAERIVGRCQDLNPERVILIKADVYDLVYDHLNAAGFNVSKERVPFPGNGWQEVFREKFAKAYRGGVVGGQDEDQRAGDRRVSGWRASDSGARLRRR